MDDSTKLVYGPSSTKFILQGDLKHSDTLFHTMDSTLYGFSSFETKKNKDKFYYDLGNNGTAMVPMYYSVPETIGRTTGFNAYDPFVKTADEFKYYDSKSPYIYLGVVFGGSGRNIVDFEFSRNVTPDWNIGFDIYKISSEKQIGSASLKESQVANTTIDLHTFYRTKNRKYHLMFHAYRFQHYVTETGGIRTDTDPEDYFQYQNSSINLADAFSADLRSRWHLYHQYSLKPFFEVYNSVQYTKSVNEYVDESPASAQYYDEFLIRTDSTLDAAQFEEYRIEAGIKGRIANRIYYTGYVKHRDLSFKYSFLNPYGVVKENYLGGDLRLLITKKNELGGKAELSDDGLFFFKGYFKNNFLKASYTGSRYSPSFMADNYLGNHYEWHNSFNPTFANSIKGSVFYQLPFVRLEALVDASTITDFVYFDYDQTPKQNNGTLISNRISGKVDFNINGKIHFENQVVYNNIAGDNPETMRAPELNYFGRWYYADILFKNDMETQIGFDLRWQSEFYGKAYDPITQQFYIQNDLNMDNYAAVDFFFIVKSNDLTLFFKLNYINQKRDGGYFESPYYPGMTRTFDMGLRWMFFD
ncbi:MAG: hypothetical protein JXR07_12995 [Reichenbachiella sp.]